MKNAFLTLILLAALAAPCLGQEVPAVPVAPSDLAVINVDYGWIELTWTDNSSNETMFVVERCAGSDAGCDVWESFALDADSTYFSDYGLANGTYYAYRVYAANAEGISDRSNIAGATTPTPPPVPPPPTNLVATTISSSQIDLTWDHPGGATYIAIHQCPDVACATSTAFRYIDGNQTSFSVAFLSPGRTYYFRVAALNYLHGTDGYSNVAQASTPPIPGPPAAPSNLVPYVVSVSQIHLVWQDNAINETGFEIDRCTGSGCTNFVLIGTVGPTISGTSSYSSSGLTPNTTYQFRVRAFNTDGNSTYADTLAATTFDVPPAAPSNLRAAVVGMHIQLNWNDNSSNEFDFNIERCIGLPSACGNSDLNFSTLVPANATSHRDSTVERKTTYTYRIRARHLMAGDSAWSNFATVTTK